jgi:hypothetical protein
MKPDPPRPTAKPSSENRFDEEGVLALDRTLHIMSSNEAAEDLLGAPLKAGEPFSTQPDMGAAACPENYRDAARNHEYGHPSS